MKRLEYLRAIKEYSNDVVAVCNAWSLSLSDAEQSEQLAMLPAPEAFKPLSREQQWKLALWAGEKALDCYDGHSKEVLRSAVDLVRVAVAGNPYKVQEAEEIAGAARVVQRTGASNTRWWVANTMYYMARMLAPDDMGDAAHNVVHAAIIVFQTSEADWRPWMEEYLRFRCQQ